MLITKNSLQTLDWAFLGQPFCETTADFTVNLQLLDWAFLGQPFCSNPADRFITTNKGIL